MEVSAVVEAMRNALAGEGIFLPESDDHLLAPMAEAMLHLFAAGAKPLVMVEGSSVPGAMASILVSSQRLNQHLVIAPSSGNAVKLVFLGK